MTGVVFEQVTAAIGDTLVVNDVSFEISPGEFVALVGRSGSGKTSLIRTIAGFTDVIGGRVLVGGDDMAGVRVADRDLGMVFQQPVLFPRRSVRRNVSFPLELRRQGPEEIRQRVDAEVRSMHLEDLLARRPDTLSRGEAQLVQIARAMVRSPRVLLLDEPLAGLDAALQVSLRNELSVLQEGYGVTTLMATNDSLDAMAMPARLFVLDHGSVVQVGSPLDVREHPATIDAARATGACSFASADVERDGEGFWLVMRGGDGRAAMQYRAWRPSLAERVGTPVTVGIRPDSIRVDPDGAVRGVVRRRGVGPMGVAQVDVGGRSIAVQDDLALDVGDTVPMSIDHLHVFDSDTGSALR